MNRSSLVERIGAEIATQMKIEGNAVRYQIEEDGAQLGG